MNHHIINPNWNFQFESNLFVLNSFEKIILQYIERQDTPSWRHAPKYPRFLTQVSYSVDTSIWSFQHVKINTHQDKTGKLQTEFVSKQ